MTYNVFSGTLNPTQSINQSDVTITNISQKLPHSHIAAETQLHRYIFNFIHHIYGSNRK